jgi:hypothetical protein
VKSLTTQSSRLRFDSPKKHFKGCEILLPIKSGAPQDIITLVESAPQST